MDEKCFAAWKVPEKFKLKAGFLKKWLPPCFDSLWANPSLNESEAPVND